MDRGAWQAMVHWVAKRGTRLKRLSTHVCKSGTHLTMSLQEEETRTHMHTEGRPRGDMGRRQPGTRLQEKPVQPTTRSWTCSLRNCEKRNFCSLSRSVGGTLLRQPSLPRPCKLTPMVSAEARPAHAAQAPSLASWLPRSLTSSVIAVCAGRGALPMHLPAPQLANATPQEARWPLYSAACTPEFSCTGLLPENSRNSSGLPHPLPQVPYILTAIPQQTNVTSTLQRQSKLAFSTERDFFLFFFYFLQII